MSRKRGEVRSRVRWNPDTETFEMRCVQCAYLQPNRGGGSSFWPLTLEFWERTNMSRCRACIKAYDQRRSMDKRRGEGLTARQAAKKLEQRRAYNRDWMRRYRERQAA